ncbi:MAG: PIN domain-containing protein [Chloroflexia bacterium]|nr:PIN domain-containing protein [Chloroflexia bacterium]
MVVIDANILIAFGLSDEPLHTQAQQRLSAWAASRTMLIAPRLFRSEVTAVIRKAVYQQRLEHEQGRIMLARLLIYPIALYEDDALLKAAYDLAEAYKRPRAYDTQYLALAQRLSCEFWTADERLFNAVKDQVAGIRWLGHVQSYFP